METWDALVVGSGLAGLTVALSLAPLRTLLITKTQTVRSGSTNWAQGGIAFPLDKVDEELHVQDTLASGAGHANEAAVRFMIERAPAALKWLEEHGVQFDRDESGNYQRGQEGAHSARRILHYHGDGTGPGISSTLVGRLSDASHISVRSETQLVKILTSTHSDQEIAGAVLHSVRGFETISTPNIILAGGGIGQLFSQTTAPEEATGDTLATAIQAGAAHADLEFVQFHPTGLSVNLETAPSQVPLLSEAIRGEGAVLVERASDASPLQALSIPHPRGSLGPRDIVARAVFRSQTEGRKVFLDARKVENFPKRFPSVFATCQKSGLDPRTDLLPVTPVVHYTMGGIKTDLAGRTNVKGLYAVGEAACTGVHGANRLASNSLLECLVFGREIAFHVKVNSNEKALENSFSYNESVLNDLGRLFPTSAFADDLKKKIQSCVFHSAGPVRCEKDLLDGLSEIQNLQKEWDLAKSSGVPLNSLNFGSVRSILETQNLLLLSKNLLTAALDRKQNLGAHFRSDAIID